MATLRINPEVHPPWLRHDEHLRLPIPAIYPCHTKGRHLLSFVVGEAVYPGIVEAGGGVTFYFDYPATLEFIRTEQYCRFKRPWLSYLPFDYYRLPTVLRRVAANVATRTRMNTRDGFPSFPVEKSLQALIYVAEQSGTSTARGRLPKAHFVWPEGKRYCVVLSHDVDTEHGIAFMPRIVDLERSFGLSSSWNIVGDLFAPNRRTLDAVYEQGCEIGLHGHTHNLRLPYQSSQCIGKTIKHYDTVLTAYAIQGYRSPYYLRSPILFSALSSFFVYDSSVPDVDVFSLGVDRGGCCSIVPFRIGSILELPVTVPYEIILHMGIAPEKLNDFWQDKIQWIKEAGGMILVNTHPEPYYLKDPKVLGAYEELLTLLSGDGCAWYALPRDVAQWYKRIEATYRTSEVSGDLSNAAD